MWVKICGVRRIEDARAAVRAGADAIGLNFVPGSPRSVTIDEARALAEAARAEGPVAIVGVFADASPKLIFTLDALLSLDLLQHHGGEPPSDCAIFSPRVVKALRVATREDLALLAAYVAPVESGGGGVDRVLFDARVPGGALGGTGQTFDWTLVDVARELCAKHAAPGTQVKLILAGGLTPDNVAEAIRVARPFGVDTASGVEAAPGVKDAALIEAFVRAAKGASR